MLPTTQAIALALGTAIVLIVPGPTNTLLAAAGLRQGFRRSVRLVAAELAGYLIAITAWGCFLAQAEQSFPRLSTFVRIASSLYIAYLAVRMWRVAISPPVPGQQAIGPRELFVATLLNPKAILFAGTIFPAAAFSTLGVYAESIAIFIALLVPIALGWIAFGAALGGGRLRWVNPIHAQRCASVVLGFFALSVGWTALGA